MTNDVLTPARQRVLDLAVEHWLENEEWPQRATIKIRLMKEGLDFDEALSDEMDPFLKGDRSKIEPTLLGLPRRMMARSKMRTSGTVGGRSPKDVVSASTRELIKRQRPGSSADTSTTR